MSPKSSRLPPSKVALLCALYKTRRLSLRQVASRFGVTHETVRSLVSRSGIRINRPYVGLVRK